MADGTVWGMFVCSWNSWPFHPHGARLFSYQAWDSGVSVVIVRDMGWFGVLLGAAGCVDQHGAIHSCYAYDNEANELGTYLDQTQIDSPPARRTAVKFDSSDRPQIAYITSDTTLMYRFLDSGVWHIFNLQTKGVTALSLAIDKNSEPLIAYTTSEGVFLTRGVGITGLSEERKQPTAIGRQLTASVVRNVLLLTGASSLKPQAASWLLDAAGRRALDLRPGANDVSGLSPGVYFVREIQAVQKIVITR